MPEGAAPAPLRRQSKLSIAKPAPMPAAAQPMPMKDDK